MAKINGNGSIVPLDGKPRAKCRKWQLRVSLGRSKRSGKYQTKTRVVKGTLTEARSALRDFIDEIESEQIPERDNAVRDVSEFTDIWLSSQRPSLAPRTLEKHQNHVKAICMHIGHARPAEVTCEDIERMAASLMEGDSPSGKPLSGTYVGNVCSTAYKLFRDMVRKGVIRANPVESAKRPRNDTVEKAALPYDSMLNLIKRLDPTHPMQLVLLLAVKLGLRRGEVHGLSWADVDFKKGVIHVQHSFDDTGALRKPKNGKARVIPLTPSVERDLIARRRAQEAQLSEASAVADMPIATISPETPIISNAISERLKPHSSTRWMARHREELGVEGLTIHELRHSYITALRRKGVSTKVAQTLAGHSSIGVTENIYDHVDIHDMKEAVTAVDW